MTPADGEQKGDDGPVPAPPGGHAPPPRRWRHRLPVRLRHYWKSLVVVIAVLSALVVCFGATMVRPYVTSTLVAPAVVTDDISGERDLFDYHVEHAIEVRFDQAAYTDMMRTFRNEGEKEFIRADIVIDGTTIEDVGLRLKGNSTLSSLRGENGRPEGPGGPPGGGKDGMEPPEGFEGGLPGGDDERGGAMPGGMNMVELSEDEPERLPWLISFDEFAEGRAYQGSTEITLRPATQTDTALNEALALGLSDAAGQTTQEFSFTSFSVNGETSVPRLVLDSPDAAWATEHGDGVLYKARAGGSLAYRGEDPTEYEEAFNQVSGEGTIDLQRVIELTRFLEESSDAEFRRDLDEYIDVESFAEYLAMQSLLSNWDAMDGPGNNYYLWYDADAERFTVLSWDLNLALSGMGGMPGMGARPENMPEQPDGEMPQMPEGMGDPGGGGLGQGGPGGGSGVLKERFLESDEFTTLYEKAYGTLYDKVVSSGSWTSILDDIVVAATKAGDDGTEKESQSLRETVQNISKEPEDASQQGPGGGTRP